MSSLKSSSKVYWVTSILVVFIAIGTLVGCAPQTTYTAGSIAAEQDTAGPLTAAKTLATSIANRNDVAYASVWDNDAVVGSLYEPFIAEVIKNSPGFQRLAVSQGRGNDPEALLREAMPKEKFITITNFSSKDWAKERLDLTNATVVTDNADAKVTAKTVAGLDIVLVMEKESGVWKVVAIEGPFLDFFIMNMGKGFDSVMPR